MDFMQILKTGGIIVLGFLFGYYIPKLFKKKK